MSLSVVSPATNTTKSVPKLQEPDLDKGQAYFEKVCEVLTGHFNYCIASFATYEHIPPAKMGVYAVFDQDECLYVGQSEDIRRRLMSHPLRSDWDFSGAIVVAILTPCRSYKQRREFEILLTDHLDPIFGLQPKISAYHTERFFGSKRYMERLKRLNPKLRETKKTYTKTLKEKK